MAFKDTLSFVDVRFIAYNKNPDNNNNNNINNNNNKSCLLRK